MVCSVLLVIVGWKEVQGRGCCENQAWSFDQPALLSFLVRKLNLSKTNFLEPLASQMLLLVFLSPIEIRTPHTPSLQWQLNHCYDVCFVEPATPNCLGCYDLQIVSFTSLVQNQAERLICLIWKGLHPILLPFLFLQELKIYWSSHGNQLDNQT